MMEEAEAFFLSSSVTFLSPRIGAARLHSEADANLQLRDGPSIDRRHFNAKSSLLILAGVSIHC